ncbi:MAG: hypothetical protein K0R90_178 [Oscillospiraceae bacterium]|nr:hypothetical protein [Oscillospiraceae bacterium]
MIGIKTYRFFVALVLSCLIFSIAGSAANEVSYQPTEKFFVNDFANIIDDQTETEIYNLGASLQEQTTAQVVIVTIPSLNGESIEDFSIKLARQWGIGQKDKDNGILILRSVEEPAIRIEVGRGLEGAVTDAKSGAILDEFFRPYFEQKEYSKGFLEGYKAILSVVYKEYNIENPETKDYYNRVQQSEQSTGKFGLGKTILIIIVVLFLFAGRFWFPILPFFGGRNNRGGFFGGSSGFGGGGGFGGFSGGGGGFGGGGSSRGF